jgi:hypothetical protein
LSGGSARAGVRRGAPSVPPRISRQLPADIEDFTGRDLALHRLTLSAAGRTPGRTGVLITAVVGKAGSGKSTLAIHAAHLVRSWFPDGQLPRQLARREAQALVPPMSLAGSAGVRG